MFFSPKRQRTPGTGNRSVLSFRPAIEALEERRLLHGASMTPAVFLDIKIDQLLSNARYLDDPVTTNAPAPFQHGGDLSRHDAPLHETERLLPSDSPMLVIRYVLVITPKWETLSVTSLGAVASLASSSGRATLPTTTSRHVEVEYPAASAAGETATALSPLRALGVLQNQVATAGAASTREIVDPVNRTAMDVPVLAVAASGVGTASPADKVVAPFFVSNSAEGLSRGATWPRTQAPISMQVSRATMSPSVAQEAAFGQSATTAALALDPAKIPVADSGGMLTSGVPFATSLVENALRNLIDPAQLATDAPAAPYLWVGLTVGIAGSIVALEMRRRAQLDIESLRHGHERLRGTGLWPEDLT